MLFNIFVFCIGLAGAADTNITSKNIEMKIRQQNQEDAKVKFTLNIEVHWITSGQSGHFLDEDQEDTKNRDVVENILIEISKFSIIIYFHLFQFGLCSVWGLLYFKTYRECFKDLTSCKPSRVTLDCCRRLS